MVAAPFLAVPVPRPGARHTTSCTGPMAVPPRWATWCWYVRTTTPACTTTAGASVSLSTDTPSSSHRPGSTPTETPDVTPTTASPPPCPNHDNGETPPRNTRNSREPATMCPPHHDADEHW